MKCMQNVACLTPCFDQEFITQSIVVYFLKMNALMKEYHSDSGLIFGSKKAYLFFTFSRRCKKHLLIPGIYMCICTRLCFLCQKWMWIYLPIRFMFDLWELKHAHSLLALIDAKICTLMLRLHRFPCLIEGFS